MKGSGLPVSGKMPVTPAMLRNAWNSMSTVSEAANKLAERSPRLRASNAMRRPQYAKNTNSPMSTMQPKNPSSSPMMAKM